MGERKDYYDLLANSAHKDNISLARELLQVTTTGSEANGTIATNEPAQPTFTCPDCGAAMVIVSLFACEPHIRAAMCGVNNNLLGQIGQLNVASGSF